MTLLSTISLEALREYVNNKAMLKINEVDNQVIKTTFQAGLNNPDLVFSLGKTPPTTMTDLLFKAQKYMNKKDALTENGIDGKQKMEEIDELQHKKRRRRIIPLVERMTMKIHKLIQDHQIF